MEKRGQFTFYRSFWEAVQGLPKKDRLPILEAIICYALDGTEPEMLTRSQSVFFLLVRPTLESSRRKSASGKQGGSKRKANDKQTDSKKEIELELESENEFEIEKEFKKELYHKLKKEIEDEEIDLDGAFETFWAEYPNRQGRDAAYSCWIDMNPDAVSVAEIMEGLARWKRSENWQKEGGRYVHSGYKFLSLRLWAVPPEFVKHKEVGYGKTL